MRHCLGTIVFFISLNIILICSGQEKFYGIPSLKELAASAVVSNNLHQNRSFPLEMQELLTHHIKWKNIPAKMKIMVDLKVNQADMHPNDTHIKGAITQPDGNELFYYLPKTGAGTQFPLPTNGTVSSVHAFDWDNEKLAYVAGNNVWVTTLDGYGHSFNSQIPSINKLLWTKNGTALLAVNTHNLWLVRLSAPHLFDDMLFKETVFAFSLLTVSDFTVSDSGNVAAVFESNHSNIELIDLNNPTRVTSRQIKLPVCPLHLHFEHDNTLLISFKNAVCKCILDNFPNDIELTCEYETEKHSSEVIKQTICINKRYLFLRILDILRIFDREQNKHMAFIYDRNLKKRVPITNAQVEHELKSNLSKTRVYGNKIGDSLINISYLTSEEI